MPSQIEMASLEELVPTDHPYRYFKQILKETFIERRLSGISVSLGREGYGIVRLFYGLLLQFMEDLNDRECERFLKENLSAKWLRGLGLSDITLDHNVFYPARKRLDTERLSQLFAQMREEIPLHGLVSKVFTFVERPTLLKQICGKSGIGRAKQKWTNLTTRYCPRLLATRRAKIG